MTTLAERIKLAVDLEECADVFPGEVIAGGGQYLGDFRNLGSVSIFGLPYPVGWTGCTWFETPAAIHTPCSCTDCFGEHHSFFVDQRYPDAAVTPIDAGPYEFWDHAIAPAKYVGTVGCGYKLAPDLNCSGTKGKCVFSGAHFSYEAPANWPLCPFSLANPSSRIRVVADTSGPVDCLADRPALEIDFSGNDLDGATFMGPNGGHDGASPDNGYNDGDRSTTGWTIDDGSCWTVRFWAKAVPDLSTPAFTCAGYELRVRVSFYPFPFHPDTLDGANSLILTADWQEFSWTFRARWVLTAYPEPMLNAPLAIVSNGAANLTGQQRPIYARKGRVHIKQVHVYPCALTTGVHIAKRIGGQP